VDNVQRRSNEQKERIMYRGRERAGERDRIVMYRITKCLCRSKEMTKGAEFDVNFTTEIERVD
jgi:hypothetical protein